MDQSLWGSKEFIAAVIGALVGGLMSMAASFLSVQLQNSKQAREKEKLVRDFVIEHANYFKELVDRLVMHFDQKNEVWAENVVEIKTAYDVVIRNIEHLVLLAEKDDRKACWKFFSDIFFISQRCWFWQNQVYENQKSLELSEASKDEFNRKILDAVSNMKSCVVDLKNAGSSFPELQRRLTSNKNG
jgi:hypothetical protein